MSLHPDLLTRKGCGKLLKISKSRTWHAASPCACWTCQFGDAATCCFERARLQPCRKRHPLEVASAPEVHQMLKFTSILIATGTGFPFMVEGANR